MVIIINNASFLVSGFIIPGVKVVGLAVVEAEQPDSIIEYGRETAA